MKKTVVSFLTVLVVFVFGLTFPVSAASLDTSIIPAEANWVIHLDIDKFNNTKFRELLDKNQTHKYQQVKKFISTLYKLDLDKDINSITIFGAGKRKDLTVVVWKGKFNEKHILSMMDVMASHKSAPYGGTTIHQWHHNFYGAFHKGYALLGWNKEAIKHTIDVISGKEKKLDSGKIMATLKEMPSDAFVKAYAHNLSQMGGGYQTSSILKHAKMAFFIAMEKGNNLKMKLKLSTSSPETAQNIEKIAQGLMAMLKMQAESHAHKYDRDIDDQHDKKYHRKYRRGREAKHLAKLLKNLDIKVNGNVIEMKLFIPSADLAKMLTESQKRMRITMK